MSEHYVVLIKDEDVPLAVDALFGVVVGDSRVQPFRLVSVNGFLDEVSGVFGGSDFAGAVTATSLVSPWQATTDRIKAAVRITMTNVRIVMPSD